MCEKRRQAEQLKGEPIGKQMDASHIFGTKKNFFLHKIVDNASSKLKIKKTGSFVRISSEKKISALLRTYKATNLFVNMNASIKWLKMTLHMYSLHNK